MIVPMQREHAGRVAELHCAALEGDFLPSLGKRFLTVFYQGVLDLGVGFGFVAVAEGQPVGFLLGSADTSGLFKRVLLSRAIAFCLAIIPALIRKPALILNVVETFLYPRKERDVAEKAEILVVGFDVAYRGSRMFYQLFNAMNDTFRAQGVRSYKATVLQTNQLINDLLCRLGFQLTFEFELYRKKWKLYTFAIK